MIRYGIQCILAGNAFLRLKSKINISTAYALCEILLLNINSEDAFLHSLSSTQTYYNFPRRLKYHSRISQYYHSLLFIRICLCVVLLKVCNFSLPD